MAAQSVPARVVMEMLGHSQMITTMNIYTHIAEEMHLEAAVLIVKPLWLN